MKHVKHLLLLAALLLCRITASAEAIEPIDIASNVDAMLYSNAPCRTDTYGDQFVGWHVLFDNDPNTIFHSDYSGRDSEDGLDHYLRVDLGEGNKLSMIAFTYTTRGNQVSYTPTTIVVEGSNVADGEYEKIATLTNLPLEEAAVYQSPVLGNGAAYRYIRYRVTETLENGKSNGHSYFYFAEFGMMKITQREIRESGTCGDNLAWSLFDDGELVIEGTGAMTNYSYDSSLPWTQYKGVITKLTIKEGVINIGDYAFYNCSSLTSITIPEGVTSIGGDAFYGCSRLKMVINYSDLDIRTGRRDNGYVAYYADRVINAVKVGDYVFETIDNVHYLLGYTGNEKELILPDDYQGENYQIKGGAFSGCSSLISINIPEGVTSIGSSAFEGCSRLERVTINCADVGSWFSEMSSIKEIVLGEGVTSIGSSAFKGCSRLERVTINCADVGSWFSEMSSIKEIVLGEGVTSIGNFAFYDCSSLTSITIPENSKLTSIGKSAFDGCSRLTSITIPEGVTDIGDYTFSGCSCLTSITIPESVTSIGKSAFDGCSSLASITIPEGVTSIGLSAFDDCSSLTAVHVSSLEAWCNIDFKSYFSNPLYYAQNLYLNGELITELIIPEGMTSIGNSALSGCSSLTSITIPEGVTSIGGWAFFGCSSLTSIVIPKSVTSIGNYAFYNCSRLTGITIPVGVTSIEYGAFYGCNSLTTIAIPEGVTSIGGWAFRGCSSLTAINIPAGVTSIGESAFSSCSKLKNIIIPENVKFIYQEAFAACMALESIKVLATEPPFAYDNTFSNSDIELCVPEEAMEAYRTTAPWSMFTSIRNLEGEEVEVKQCAAPVISYINGKVSFTCETEGVTLVSETTASGVAQRQVAAFDLAAVYTITAYATKEGYLDSETVTAVLCWIECIEEHETPSDPNNPDTGITIPSRPVLIQSSHGVITLTGLAEGTKVRVCDLAGVEVAHAVATGGKVTLSTNLAVGSTVIVYVGEQRSVKVIVR